MCGSHRSCRSNHYRARSHLVEQVPKEESRPGKPRAVRFISHCFALRGPLLADHGLCTQSAANNATYGVPQPEFQPTQQLAQPLPQQHPPPVIVATKVYDPAPGAVPVSTDSAYDAMPVKELRMLALEMGVDGEAIEIARDEDDPRAALLALIQAHADVQQEPGPDYASMSVRDLRGIAAEHGADPEAIELARDSDDPVQELTLLITKQRRARVQGP
jgi:hypothetical protein